MNISVSRLTEKDLQIVDELALWKAETSDEVLDAVIDAHIFFDNES